MHFAGMRANKKPAQPEAMRDILRKNISIYRLIRSSGLHKPCFYMINRRVDNWGLRG
jgi:hypothetical protein